MSYRIDILDRDKKRSAEVTGLVRAKLFERVNGIALLEIETVDSEIREHVLPGAGFLRLYDDSTWSLGTFRIFDTVMRREGERPSLTVTARHIMGDMSAEVFADTVDCLQYTPQELMALVLGYSAFGAGTVVPTTTVPYVRFEYEPVLDCLLRICSLTGGELELDESTGEISLLDRVGADNGAVFRYGLNLSGAERRISTSRMSNRVYGVGGGNPPLLLTGATDSGGMSYASDSSSVTEWGLFEGVYHDPLLEDVENLVDTPALDGAYVSGLCEDWSKMGSPTVSRNDSASYRLYGKYSQHVTASTAGQGIEQAVMVTSGTVYSLSATISVVSGEVRVQIVDGASTYKRMNAVTGSGFTTVRIENWKANNSSVSVRIIQEGATAAEFYVDSVQVAEGASTKPFTVGKSADKLWTQTVEQMVAQKEPEITYKIELVDSSVDETMQTGGGQFSLGDTINVVDPTLDFDVSTRVMEREVDILRPWRVQVRLDNAARNLADVVAALREAQEKGLRQQRTALAESSMAAEVGSQRLGFRNLAFRFYSTVTVLSWNGLSWAAGQLRIGDGWHSISAGSASGLAGSSTYYFYFDRTSPTAISYTTSSGSAEGEDRILLFAVTTTSTPTLCVVHPLGVIHV